MDRLAPGVLRKLLITTIFIILVPLTTLFSVQCDFYSDLTSSFSPSTQVISSGLSAVLAVHLVIAYFIYTVYVSDIAKSN